MLNSERELDLLEEYMRYWISHKINPFWGFENPHDIIQFYRQSGILFKKSNSGIMDFKEWKMLKMVLLSNE